MTGNVAGMGQLLETVGVSGGLVGAQAAESGSGADFAAAMQQAGSESGTVIPQASFGQGSQGQGEGASSASGGALATGASNATPQGAGTGQGATSRGAVTQTAAGDQNAARVIWRAPGAGQGQQGARAAGQLAGAATGTATGKTAAAAWLPKGLETAQGKSSQVFAGRATESAMTTANTLVADKAELSAAVATVEASSVAGSSIANGTLGAAEAAGLEVTGGATGTVPAQELIAALADTATGIGASGSSRANGSFGANGPSAAKVLSVDGGKQLSEGGSASVSTAAGAAVGRKTDKVNSKETALVPQGTLVPSVADGAAGIAAASMAAPLPLPVAESSVAGSGAAISSASGAATAPVATAAGLGTPGAADKPVAGVQAASFGSNSASTAGLTRGTFVVPDPTPVAGSSEAGSFMRPTGGAESVGEESDSGTAVGNGAVAVPVAAAASLPVLSASSGGAPVAGASASQAIGASGVAAPVGRANAAGSFAGLVSESESAIGGGSGRDAAGQAASRALAGGGGLEVGASVPELTEAGLQAAPIAVGTSAKAGTTARSAVGGTKSVAPAAIVAGAVGGTATLSGAVASETAASVQTSGSGKIPESGYGPASGVAGVGALSRGAGGAQSQPAGSAQAAVGPDANQAGLAPVIQAAGVKATDASALAPAATTAHKTVSAADHLSTANSSPGATNQATAVAAGASVGQPAVALVDSSGAAAAAMTTGVVPAPVHAAAGATSAGGGQLGSDGAVPSGQGVGVGGGVDASLPHTTLSATPTSLEVGVSSGTHGWLKIRAELNATGEVNASLTGANAAAESKLRGDLPALSSYLQGEKVQVGALQVGSVLHTAAVESSSTFSYGGGGAGGSAVGADAGTAGGRAQQQQGQQGGDAVPISNGAQDNDAVLASRIPDAALYGVSTELGGSDAGSSTGYGAGGGWLNVRV